MTASLAMTPQELVLADIQLPYSAQGWLNHYVLPVNHAPLWRFLHHKRWVYVWIDGSDWILGLAVIDLNYASKCFVYWAQQDQARPLWQYNHLFSRPSAIELSVHPDQKLKARFDNSAMLVDVKIDAQGALHVSVQASDFSARVEAAPATMIPLVAANHLPQGDCNLTQKVMYTQARVQIQHQQQDIRFDHARVSVDLTDGFLPHQTAWYWASLNGVAVTGENLALNLVQGFNGACECVYWSDSHPTQLQLVGEGIFESGQNWRIRSQSKRFELTFKPWSTLRQSLNWGPINSDFQQLYGSYSGWIQCAEQKIEFENVRGIAEYQRVNW